MRIKQRIFFIIAILALLGTSFYFISNANVNDFSHPHDLKNIKQFNLNIEDYSTFTDNYCQANFPDVEEYAKPVKIILILIIIILILKLYHILYSENLFIFKAK